MSILLSKLFFVFYDKIEDNRFLVDLFFGHFFGYLASICLRYIYRRLKYRTVSIFKLGVRIILLSTLFALLWYYSHFFQKVLTGSNQFWFTFEYVQAWISTWAYYIIYDLLMLIAWSFIYFAIKIRSDFEIEKEQNKQNVLLAQRAELQLLRYQLNPHFLFNSLNSIRALTLKDVKGARDMISELSEFLKYSVLTKNNLEISLNKEIEALKHYLKIEKIRFKEKLNIIYNISPEVEELPIPVLLLHPLVENAIKYGMQTADLPLEIQIKAFQKGNDFYLEISNNGRWIDHNEKENFNTYGTSSGMQNVKDRLLNSYPGNHNFKIINKPGWVTIQIMIRGIGEN